MGEKLTMPSLDSTAGPQKTDGLRFGPLGASAVHLCVDMQRLFGEPTPWATPWMSRVIPAVVRLAEARPNQLLFTRFIPLNRASEGEGTWRRYYERWEQMTLAALDLSLLNLVEPLIGFAPPAPVIDKRRYSPWIATELHSLLRNAQMDTLVITGAETDVCVLSTVLGAIDLGYRVVVATDAVCSSADETHDAIMTIYQSRFGMQVETADVEEILDVWRA
jgi:nicotinamidase-related amidase